MENKNIKILEQIEFYTINALIILMPVFFLPIFPDMQISKIALLAFGVSVILFIKALKAVFKGSIEYSGTKLDFPIFLLLASYLVNGLFISPNRFDAFLLPGTASIIIFSSILFLIINQSNNKLKSFLPKSIIISAVILAFTNLIFASGLLKSLSFSPEYLKLTGFSLIGANYQAIIFFVITLPLSISYFIKNEKATAKAIWGTFNVFIIIGIVASFLNAPIGQSVFPKLPQFNTSWSIAIDTLKEKPLMGIGAGNYLTAFNRFRPISYNQTELWNLRFATANSFYLTLLTEAGLIAFAAIILILINVKNIIFNKNENNTKISLLVLVTAFLFFPSNITFIILFFVYLSLNSKVHKAAFGTLTSSENETVNKLPALVFSVPVLLGTLLFMFYSSRILYAEYLFKSSLDALSQNNGGSSYDLLSEAISINPYVDRYRANYAQLNFAIANNIAQVQDLSEEDRNTVTQLIQQAIAEGKATVALNPQKSGNWEILANIYQAIIPLAEGSDQFAIEAYSQAINLDPLNPNLRVALGGIYFGKGNYDQAIKVFELATAVKPDFANAHFNLAYALKQSGKDEAAVQEMALVVSLVDRESADYEAAKSALESFQSALNTEESEIDGESLNAPNEVEQQLNPPIELPEEAAPQTPEPTATPDPTPVI